MCHIQFQGVLYYLSYFFFKRKRAEKWAKEFRYARHTAGKASDLNNQSIHRMVRLTIARAGKSMAVELDNVEDRRDNTRILGKEYTVGKRKNLAAQRRARDNYRHRLFV